MIYYSHGHLDRDWPTDHHIPLFTWCQGIFQSGKRERVYHFGLPKDQPDHVRVYLQWTICDSAQPSTWGRRGWNYFDFDAAESSVVLEAIQTVTFPFGYKYVSLNPEHINNELILYRGFRQLHYRWANYSDTFHRAPELMLRLLGRVEEMARDYFVRRPVQIEDSEL